MRNFVTKLVMMLAILITPVVAEAQTTWTGRITDNPIKTNNINLSSWGGSGGAAGGGFTFQRTAVNGVAQTFTDFLVYCIDPIRQITVPGGPYTFTIMSVSDFVNGPVSSELFNGVSRTNPTVDNFEYAINRIGDYDLTKAVNTTVQTDIWNAIFNGSPTLTAPTNVSPEWSVLWNGNNQTFLVQVPPPSVVPEPSSMALMSAGLVGLVGIARRRKTA